MKTRKLRLLSALLALAMLLALLPTAAFAADDTTYTGTVNSINFKYTVDSENNATITGVEGSLPADGVVVIPDKIGSNPVTAIGDRAFQNSDLTAVDMSNANNLETIGEMAFLTCTSLNRVDFPKNGVLKTIGEGAFSTGDRKGATFTELCIPASVETIGYRAFGKCSKLETVTFAPGSKLKEIGGDAFFNTALESITIPEKVTTIGSGAFSGCNNLQTVYYDGDNATAKEALQSAVGEKFQDAWRVTFDTVDGSAVTPQNVKNGQTATKPTAPTKKEYDFAGWYIKDADGKWAAKPFDFNTLITDNMTLYARWAQKWADLTPATPVTYKLTVTDGTAWVNGKEVTEAAAGDVVTIKADETAFDGMAFERWEVREGEVKLENDHAAETTFTMPAGEVQLEAMYQAADANDSGWDAATVVTGAVIGTGTAILAYHIGMEVYAEQVLGKDVAVPRTRGEVALLAWQLAGSPAVNVEGEPLSEAAQAEKWAVESGLMQPDAEGNFNGTKKMSKWNALRTLDAAKKMG